MRQIIALAVLAALSGCAVGPDYERPAQATPPTWRHAESVASAADLANVAWWKGFGDPRLEALVQLALDENADLKIAASRVMEFAARRDLAKSQELPQVSIDGRSSRDKLSEERQTQLAYRTPINSANYELKARVSWELDIWGRVQRTNEAYLADLLAIEETRRAITLTVVSDVVSTYVELLAADRELALLKSDLASRQAALKYNETRQKQGGASMLPVLVAKAAVEQTEAAIPAKEREIAAAENALSILVGSAPAAVARSRDLSTLATQAVPSGIPSEVLAQRPDVRAAEQNLIAANARIGVAKAEYFPTISLTGLFGYASTDLTRLISAPASFGSLGTDAVVKVFTAGRIDANVRQAEATRALQLESYRKAVQNAFFEVEDALVFHRKVAERAALLKRQRDTTQAVAAMTRKRFESGLIPVFEVLDAEREVTAVDRQLVEVQRDGHLSLIRIYKAMGGGWRQAAPDLLAGQASAKTN